MGEAGSSYDMCLFAEIQLLSSCPLTCCLLLIIILFLCLSLQKHARLLLLHGNHLLVSLSCSAASVIHNIRPPPSATPQQMQQHKQAIRLFFFFSLHSPLPALFWLFSKWLHQNVTGISWLSQQEKCCLSLLLASKCCCKGIFGPAQHYPQSLLWWCVFNWCSLLWSNWISPSA